MRALHIRPYHQFDGFFRPLVAVAPAILVIACWSSLPALLTQAPGAIFYMVVFISVLLGGAVPGLTTTLIFTLYQGLVLRPSTFTHPFLDPLSTLRLTMFSTTSVFIVFLIDSLRRSRMHARRDQEHLRLALDSAGIGAWDLCLATGAITCDEESRRCCGLIESPKYFSAMLLDHVHPGDREALTRRVREGLATRKDFREEFRIMLPDGGTRWLSGSGRSLVDREGKPRTLLGTVVDITPRKTLEQDLRRAIAVRDDFLSIASHELKTPLTALKLQIEVLLAWVKNPAELQLPRERLGELLTRSNEQLDRLALLINDLLDVTRATHDTFSINRQDLDATGLLQDIVLSLRSMASAANTTIQANIQSGVRASWDPQRIEQLISNLIANALKYGNGSAVELALSVDAEDTLLSVTNQGPGIAAEDFARIFEKFQRLDAGAAQGGLGLGLFICREIAVAHQGSIWVESRPKVGTTFFVKLPVHPAAASGEMGKHEPPL